MGEETRAAVRAIEMVERKDRVLIVEDEDNARKGYEQLLQRWGCDVVGVGTAEEALAKFASYQPDTLIADVELPGMNGLDLLKQLGTELHGVPAIIITGKGSEERAVAAIEAGAFWYIEKPLKGPVLRALLDRALSKARDSRQLAVLQRQLRERSEEHTSELQSHSDLVCRLLLEKKKFNGGRATARDAISVHDL